MLDLKVQVSKLRRALLRRGLGIEATGHSRWSERLLAELNYETWIGDPARIRVKQVRKQKNDRKDAEHILRLMVKDDFPRICGADSKAISPSKALRDS